MKASRRSDTNKGPQKTTTTKPWERAQVGRTTLPAIKRAPTLSSEPTKAVEAVLPTRKQGQPKKHAPKTRMAAALRRKKLITALLNGENLTEAGIATGLSPKTAASQVSQILNEPKVVKNYLDILDAAGATDEACAKVIVEAMDATRTVSCVSGKDAGAGSIDFIDIIDHPTRLKAVDMVHKVRSRYVEKKVITGPDGGPIQVKATELTDEELFNIARRGRPGATPAKKSPRKPA